ncbi:MAG TPA: class I SAM-dependent methyltransferase, partial [Candidatus Eisenbacteria bacterium]|nr:class I SAM-dependent methyltransferase [Candidatus Eisenbacteria bacterium]
LRITGIEDIGPHYARTLREWRTRLLARADRVRALGHDDRALRLWEFYFAYCEGGFEERALGDAQILLAKPGARLDPPPAAR